MATNERYVVAVDRQTEPISFLVIDLEARRPEVLVHNHGNVALADRVAGYANAEEERTRSLRERVDS